MSGLRGVPGRAQMRQGGLIQAPPRARISGQPHHLAYITPEEAAMLRRNGGGMGEDGQQVYGPSGVPAYPEPGMGGDNDHGGAGAGGDGGPAGGSPAGDGGGVMGGADPFGGGDAEGSPAGDGGGVMGGGSFGAGGVGAGPSGNSPAAMDPGIQQTANYGAVPTTGSLATDLAGIAYGAHQGFAQDPLSGVVGLATRGSLMGHAQDVGLAGIAAAERAGISVDHPSTNDQGGGATEPVVAASTDDTDGTGGTGDTPAAAPAWPAGWNEDAFLAANPDVAAAVQGGIWDSGYAFNRAWEKFAGAGYGQGADQYRQSWLTTPRGTSVPYQPSFGG